MTATQQVRAYRAEEACSGGRSFAHLAAARQWVDDLVNEPWWPERFPGVEAVELEGDALGSCAGVSNYDREARCGLVEVKLPVREQTLLHELAHCCAIAEVGEGVGHGPHWARTLLELVFRVQGEAAWLGLRAAFLAEGVDFGE